MVWRKLTPFCFSIPNKADDLGLWQPLLVQEEIKIHPQVIVPVSDELRCYSGEPRRLFWHRKRKIVSRRNVLRGASLGPLVNKRVATGDVRGSCFESRSIDQEIEVVLNKSSGMLDFTL